MSDRPEVSVIVGAYGPSPYLLAGVRSILAQTVSRDRYEVFVTKSLADPDVDRFLEANGIPFHLDDDPKIGSWLLRAVASTRAPYVAFLDDDDLFEPERLAHVLEVLRANPTLGFYRNRVRVIDERGDAVPPDSWRSLELDGYFDERGPVTIPSTDKSGVVALGFDRTKATFNSSTMVVRRELLEGEYRPVFARTQLPDLALFVLAVLSPFGLYLDDRRLTQYRYHSGNVTHRLPWLKHARDSHDDLVSAARDRGNSELARRLSQESCHFDRLYRSGTIVEKVCNGASRGEVARLAGEYLRFLGRHPAERAPNRGVWAAELYAGSYLLAPSIARRVGRRQAARRRP